MLSIKISTATALTAIVIALIMAQHVASAVSPCDENGQCKYGGVCGTDGMCSCAFNCEYELWGRNLYCGSGRVKVYRNLCQLVSHACELQKDIAMIPIRHKKEYLTKCQGERAPPSEMLCGGTVSSMNRCSTRSSIRSQSTGGICINDLTVKQQYCKCPTNRAGENCEKSVSRRPHVPRTSSVLNVDAENIRILNIEVVILSMVVVFFVVCLIAITWRYKKLMRNGSGKNVIDEKTQFCEQAPNTYRSSLFELLPRTICPKRDTKVELDTKSEKVNSAFFLEN